MISFALVLSLALSQAEAKVDLEYRATVESWRTKKEQDLRGPDSWLTLVGLFWLHPGQNTFGTSQTTSARLPEAAGEGGTLTLEGNKVYLEPSANLQLNGKPVKEKTLLKTDIEDAPDEIATGKIKLNIINREGRLGIRAWDPENPERKNFSGRIWFPVDEKFRVEAKFKAFEKPTELNIKNVIGMRVHAQSPGHLEFQINGQKYSLLAEGDAAKGFFLNFKDKSSSKDTYPAGRYLSTEPEKNGIVVIDFNKAVNPPCAFTHFATCPLAPRENSLPIAIDAGEKYSGHSLKKM